MGIGSSKPPRKGPDNTANPALTIRNITIHPLDLVLVERFEGPPRPAGGFTHFFHFNNNTLPSSSGGDDDDDDPAERIAIDNVHIGAFATAHTPPSVVTLASPRDRLRLTFQTPLLTQGGTNESDTPHRYTVDVSAAHDATHSHTHTTQTVLSSTGGPLSLTAVYVAGASHLTLYSAAALAGWMAELPDALPLSALSIPGTHNSPTSYVALPSVRCQAVGVRAQLDNGVRFLDVRVSVARDHDHLALVHSVFPISLTGTKWFADVLADDLYAFLDANPRETVLLSVKREGTGRGTDQHLSRYLFERYCGNEHAAKYWFTEPRIPTLGEARGKIVLIRRFHIDEDLLGGQHGGTGWGIDGSAWPDNCADGTVGSGLIRVQDFYEVGQSDNIDKKITMATCHLEKACQRPAFPAAQVADAHAHGPAEPPPLFINFLTASNFFNASCWPERVAAKVNPSIIEYLCLKHAHDGQGPEQLDVGDAATGIVVTDWVGLEDDWDLIRCVVGWNARLQLKY